MLCSRDRLSLLGTWPELRVTPPCASADKLYSIVEPMFAPNRDNMDVCFRYFRPVSAARIGDMHSLHVKMPAFATPRGLSWTRVTGQHGTLSRRSAKLDECCSYRYLAFHAFITTFSRERRFDANLQADGRALANPKAAFEGILGRNR